MKKIFILLFGFFSLFGTFSVAQEATNVMALPKLERYVTDFTNTLSTEELNTLEAIAENYTEQTSNQIVTVIIPHRQGYELFDIGMRIFNQNGIGSAKDNNGLLLVLVKEEKKIRIIVGYGLEDKITDLTASRMIEDYIRPFVNEGKWFDAVKSYYEQAQKNIDGSIIDDVFHSMKNLVDNETFQVIIAFFCLFFGIGIGRILKDKKKSSSKTKYYIAIILVIIILLVLGIFIALIAWLFGLASGLGIIKGSSGGSSGNWGSGGSWSSGGRSGGGFSGGGGRSGGGGAGD